MTRVHPKVAAGGLAAAVSVLLVGILDRAGVTLTPLEASSLTTALSSVSAYLKGS